MEKRKNLTNHILLWGFAVLLLSVTFFYFTDFLGDEREYRIESSPDKSDLSDAPNELTEIQAFAEYHNITMKEYPEELLDLLEKNPETKEYVFNYPLKKHKKFEINLTEYENSECVPLLMQWDERWGYGMYAGELMGLSGCGPTCLSMVSIYLLNDAKYTPAYIASFSEKNLYSYSGKGSKWSLISEGGKKLGMDIKELSLVEGKIIQNLKEKNPIICVMGPGDFTTTGHFIVMTEYVEGKIRINDPNSRARSEKLWNLSDIIGQIKNLWVCRKN